jgi:hypothetical protein
LLDPSLHGLLHHKIAVDPSVLYVSGGTFYIRRDCLFVISKHSDLFQPFPKTNAEIMAKVSHTDNMIHDVCAFDDYNIGVAFHREQLPPVHINTRDVLHWWDC